ncbi:alpha/beta fold hydrolase [Actinophytocola sp. NPDC049390]|uniref:alpha/beta fold hydrolase n=1 Tax=Actinophytocola sp. NPDC049390 TaxID=3363894 RepID=UPI0037B9B697
MRSLRIERAGTILTALVRDGAGTPLVLVPGVMADAESWLPVVERIEAPNPVVVVNRRGRTPSGPVGEGYTVRTEVDDLHGFLDDLGGEAHLFGWSYGGLIAAETAVERRDLRSLTLYEPVAAPFVAEYVAPLRAAAASGDPGRAVEIVNRDVSGFSTEYVDELRRGPAWPTLVRLAAPLAEELAAINAHNPAYDRYRDLETSVTLIVGERSEGGDPYGEPFARFVAAFPRASVTRMTGQGHLAHVHAPDVLGTHITDAVR